MDFRERLDRLRHLNDGLQTPSERGRAFEKFLHDLLAADNLQPRTSFRPTGEEVDGSFIYDGRIFLLEAKWCKDPQPASALYEFKGKVDGKLTGTLGAFVSMSGYSEDAATALRSGKDLNIILFGHDDVDHVVRYGFKQVLAFKLRAAAETGEPFAPYDPQVARGEPYLVAVVVEGENDAAIVRGLIRRIGMREPLPPVTVVSAGGQSGLATVSLALARAGRGKVLLISEGDEESQRSIDRVRRELVEDDVQIIEAPPGVESWLSDEPRRVHREDIERLTREVDIDQLAQQDDAFRQFLKALGMLPDE